MKKIMNKIIIGGFLSGALAMVSSLIFLFSIPYLNNLFTNTINSLGIENKLIVGFLFLFLSFGIIIALPTD